MQGLTFVKNFLKNYLIIVKIGLLTGLIIISFEVINLFVIYQYIKLDYYLSLVAVVFFLTGILINKKVKGQELPAKTECLLTNKEMQILQLISEGKTNKEIASCHFIEVSTVKTHINNIYSKLSLRNRKEARAKFAEIAEKKITI
jgi:DNA-binding CsgD family transcriptional regulator